MTPIRTSLVSLTVAALWVALCLPSCRRHNPTSEAEPAPASSSAPKNAPDLRATSDNLLLTWIDPQGDFHVVQKAAEVPEDARGSVRVVDLKRRDSNPDSVYVADLTKANPDGSYPTRVLPRREWDELGAARRKVRLEQMGLKPDAPNPAGAASQAPAASSASVGSAAAGAEGIVAIIYGADWCKPCHEAEKHLKRTGILVIKKNIEEDPRARQEMQQKLVRAGRAGSSIPVIDIMGQLLIGFSPGALDQAVAGARRQQAAKAQP